MPEEFREPSGKSYIHVTLETAGQKFTSSLGPLTDEEGWNVWRNYLADMRRARAYPVLKRLKNR